MTGINAAGLRHGGNLGYLAETWRSFRRDVTMIPNARSYFFYFYGFFRPWAERVERHA